MKFIQNKKLIYIFFSVDNELKVLFQFDSDYLYFDSLWFSVSDDTVIYQSYSWQKINYDAISEGISIVKVRVDEGSAYFIEFSNGDIFHIYQQFNGERWWDDFEIVSKHNPEGYSEVTEHMNEDFVEDVEL